MEIEVSIQSKYGKTLFYPESEDALFLAKFCGRPTLLKRQLKMAVENGWSVRVKKNEIDLKKILLEKPLKKSRKNERRTY